MTPTVDITAYEEEFRQAGLLFERGEDEPGKVYAPHVHGWTKLVTLGGSIRLRTDDGWHELRTGDEYEVRSGELHEAVVGPDGWRWLAAWKPEEDDTFAVHEA